MLVSMTPNEEVKTIHASLNDGSLRKWEFEPYTENGKIELTDQDYATIRSIKGNTVKFNQLISGERTWTNTNTDSATYFQPHFQFYNDNTYLTYKLLGDYTSPQYIKNIFTAPVNANRIVYKHNGIISDIVIKKLTLNIYQGHKYYTCFNAKGVDVQTVGGLIIEDIQLFDLTLMGIDNLTTVQEVEDWLSNNIGLLPYYDYTLGTLISFRGTGLKSTGKNIFNGVLQNGTLDQYGQEQPQANRYRSGFIRVLPNTTYCSSIDGISKRLNFFFYDENQNFIITVGGEIITTPSNCGYLRFFFDQTILNVNLQVEIGSTPSSYESYTSSTLSLPISTLFPTGMKEAGSVFDEISDKAYTRVGMVDLGTLNWIKATNQSGNIALAYTDETRALVKPYLDEIPASEYLISSKYSNDYSSSTAYFQDIDNCIVINSDGRLIINDNSFADKTVEEIKSLLSGVYLNYQLITPTSQDISLDLTYPVYNNGTEQILPVNDSTPTTSPMVATIEYPDRTEEVNFLYKQTTFESAIPQFSLVCKNQELPMALEDGKLICECDSSITNESGFFDAKVKMQDLDSVAYSQKIQLHVERGIND